MAFVSRADGPIVEPFSSTELTARRRLARGDTPPHKGLGSDNIAARLFRRPRPESLRAP
jgi:hypothetical protein